jgi:hypothetical protein
VARLSLVMYSYCDTPQETQFLRFRLRNPVWLRTPRPQSLTRRHPMRFQAGSTVGTTPLLNVSYVTD